MDEAVFTIPVTGTLSIKGDSVTIRIRESTLTVQIERKRAKTDKRLALEPGQTLFDIVLEIAMTFAQTGVQEFSAAELYHTAIHRYPDLNLKRNSWGAHVISSAPNHPSYHHHTATRRFFRYLGNGKYSLDPSLLT